jgi:hypothetical protein
MAEYLIVNGTPVEIPRSVRADGDAAVIAFVASVSRPVVTPEMPTPDRALSGEEQ